MARDAAQLAAELNSHRNAFKAFLAGRLGSDAEAEDLLQHGLLKAMQRAGDVQDDTKLTAWFYQLLRHAVVDHYRSRSAARRREDAVGRLHASLSDNVAGAPTGWQAQICTCLGGVVDTLKPPQAELLRRVDLDGESVRDAAQALKLTANNASVILHRARKELRLRLEAFCGDCTASSCLECDCAEREDSA